MRLQRLLKGAAVKTKLKLMYHQLVPSSQPSFILSDQEPELAVQQIDRAICESLAALRFYSMLVTSCSVPSGNVVLSNSAVVKSTRKSRAPRKLAFFKQV